MTSNHSLDERLDRARGADFRLWVEALLGLLPAEEPRVRRLRGIPRLAAAPVDTANCRVADVPPVPTDPLEELIGLATSGATRVPELTDQDRVHTEFAAAVRTGDPRATAKAWMRLRAVDADGVTPEERQTGSAAARAWGVIVLARENQ